MLSRLTEICGFAPQGILWDMDGTIIDTEPFWGSCSRTVVESHGGWWDTEDSESLRGAATVEHMARMEARLKDIGVTVPGEQLYAEVEEILARDVFSNPPVIPGAIELLDAFREAGLPQGLVTATRDNLVRPVLDFLGKDYFATVVTGSLGLPGKPDPAPYQAGMTNLNLTPSLTLVFEDSANGERSATGAGARVRNVTREPLADLARDLGLM